MGDPRAEEWSAYLTSLGLPRKDCVFPDCLTVAQGIRLAAEIDCEMLGGEHPEPDLTDWRLVHHCKEPERKDDTDEPPF
jgi:hypothetical protein